MLFRSDQVLASASLQRDNGVAVGSVIRVPFFTPASLAIAVAATAHGIGDWGVVVVEFAAAALGLVTILGSLRHLDEL